MKYFSLLFLLSAVAFSHRSFAQTDVGGDILSNITWDLAGSPYTVKQDVTVLNGVTLTIDAGVTVKFEKNRSLGVEGMIRAIGTGTNPITFTSDSLNPVDFYWGGIYLSSTAVPFDYNLQSGCFFQYCNFSNSGTPNQHVDPTENTTLTVFSQVSLGFDHCLVEFSACGLVGSSGSQVSNNIFNECTCDAYSGYLIKVGQNSDISNNLIYKSGVANSTGILTANKNIAIHNNLFIENSFVFINAITFADSSQFYDNTLVDNSGELSAIFMNIEGASLYRNTFTRNKAGFQTFTLSNCSPDFHNNNILRNETETQGVEVEMVTATGAGQFAKEENNYWGYSDSTSIAGIIIDGQDNSGLCKADFVPFKLSPDTSAPVIPPLHVLKKALLNNSIRMSWNKNSESDLDGYRVYHGGYNGYSFSSFTDAGSDTSIELSGLLISEPIAVTAYDNAANGINDQYEGHESWFTLAVIDTNVGIHSPLSGKNEIEIFPNPSDGNVQIRLPQSFPSVSLTVFDLEGRKVLESTHSGAALIPLHLPHAGVYFLEAISANHILGNQKIIVIE